MRDGAEPGDPARGVPFHSARDQVERDRRGRRDERRRARDPDQMVASMWAAKVVPYFEKKAGPFLAVRDLAAKRAGRGRRQMGLSRQIGRHAVDFDGPASRERSSPPTPNRAPRTIGVDASGQGKTEATVQIGPAMRGTAIRDALDFVSFGDFTNQIDFARFGKAFNIYVSRNTLEKLPRDDLVGRKVDADRRLRARFVRRTAAGDAGRDHDRIQAVTTPPPPKTNPTSSCASKG